MRLCCNIFNKTSVFCSFYMKNNVNPTKKGRLNYTSCLSCIMAQNYPYFFYQLIKTACRYNVEYQGNLPTWHCRCCFVAEARVPLNVRLNTDSCSISSTARADLLPRLASLQHSLDVEEVRKGRYCQGGICDTDWLLIKSGFYRDLIQERILLRGVQGLTDKLLAVHTSRSNLLFFEATLLCTSTFYK